MAVRDITVRRFALVVIASNRLVTLLIPLSPNEMAIYMLRTLQGLLGGMTIPMLLAAALGGLPQAIRLYGPAAYALTATLTPNFAATLAALWTHAVGWQFVFLEILPFAVIAWVAVWWGFPEMEPQYQRIRMFDWRGALGSVFDFGAFSTMLQQGDRPDWFNSPAICVLALMTVATLPLLIPSLHVFGSPDRRLLLLTSPLLGLELAVPDHTVLSERSQAFVGGQRRVAVEDNPLRLMLKKTSRRATAHAIESADLSARITGAGDDRVFGNVSLSAYGTDLACFRHEHGHSSVTRMYRRFAQGHLHIITAPP